MEAGQQYDYISVTPNRHFVLKVLQLLQIVIHNSQKQGTTVPIWVLVSPWTLYQSSQPSDLIHTEWPVCLSVYVCTHVVENALSSQCTIVLNFNVPV